MKSIKGYTLVELVISIIVLGVLAVTAIPKFIGLSQDSKNAVMMDLAGKINSAAQIVYAKSVIQNEAHLSPLFTGTLPTNYGDVDGIKTVYGYPRAEDIDLLLSSSELKFIDTINSGKVVAIYFKKDDQYQDCFLTYKQPTEDNNKYRLLFANPVGYDLAGNRTYKTGTQPDCR
ncbi:type II secretion system protein [Moritella sp. 24]|uniref:type II secretion system protein n=1 Tax=Moritella sp. 24 TaxID=2746230 RepID=UPI001BA545A1|nr:type II secretion system protein [Moritella sp. 24]QUM77673.1 type II secretion system protein [Moritella sp. 24]